MRAECAAKIDESFAERYIPADDSVRRLDRIVEEMDLSALMRAYDSYGRPPPLTCVPFPANTDDQGGR